MTKEATGQAGRRELVRLQQEHGRRALALGDVQGARAVLSLLRQADFVGSTIVCEICLQILRDEESTEATVRAAAEVLCRLPTSSE